MLIGLLGSVLLGWLAVGTQSLGDPSLAALEQQLAEKHNALIESFQISPQQSWLAFSLRPPAGYGLDFGDLREASLVKYPDLAHRVELGTVKIWSWALEDEVLWLATSADEDLLVLDPSTGDRKRVERPSGYLYDLQGLDGQRALILVGPFDDFDEPMALCAIHSDLEGAYDRCTALTGEFDRLEWLGAGRFALLETRPGSEGQTRIDLWQLEGPSRLCQRRLPADQLILGVFPSKQKGTGLVLALTLAQGELVIQRVSCEGAVGHVARASGACATDRIDLGIALAIESYRIHEKGIELLFTSRAGDKPRPRRYFIGYDGTVECGQR